METTKELIDFYHKVAEVYSQRIIENPSTHIINVVASVMMTRDKVLNGGSFVQSIVLDKLEEAVCRSDSECYENLRLFVMAKKYCFIEQFENLKSKVYAKEQED